MLFILSTHICLSTLINWSVTGWAKTCVIFLTKHCKYVRLSFMLCWLCISKCACNETKLMHYLSSVYWVTLPPHVSGWLVAHHQEVAMYIRDNCYMLYGPPTVDSPKHVEVEWLNKQKINSASGWFHYVQLHGIRRTFQCVHRCWTHAPLVTLQMPNNSLILPTCPFTTSVSWIITQCHSCRNTVMVSVSVSLNGVDGRKWVCNDSCNTTILGKNPWKLLHVSAPLKQENKRENHIR
jgi:hypothetical protein